MPFGNVSKLCKATDTVPIGKLLKQLESALRRVLPHVANCRNKPESQLKSHTQFVDC